MRPSQYTDEIATAMCIRIAEGETITKICSDEGMPCKATFFNWLSHHPQFVDKYARAKEAQAEKLAEEILEIADEASRDTITTEDGREVTNHEAIARSRLRVDARKWLASKMYPKKYGDKVDHTVGGNGTPVGVRIERTIVDPVSNGASIPAATTAEPV